MQENQKDSAEANEAVGASSDPQALTQSKSQEFPSSRSVARCSHNPGAFRTTRNATVMKNDNR